MPARRLPQDDVNFIVAALQEGRSVKSIQNSVRCGSTAIYDIRVNLDVWGQPYPPATAYFGPRRKLTAHQQLALLDWLDLRPTAYLDEMQDYLFDTFGVEASAPTVCRALKAYKWSRKVCRRRAAERCEELRTAWKGRIIRWDADQIVCLDESAANERSGDRKFGWSPRCLAAGLSQSLHRSERWSILPAVDLDGFFEGTLIFQGSITQQMFDDWVESVVIPQMNSRSSRRSVLVLDNASQHKSQRLKDVCVSAGVELAFLPPYSPDFNPIEACFKDLKAWLKRNHRVAAEFSSFGNFLTFAVQQTGGKHIKAHFRAAGYKMNEE